MVLSAINKIISLFLISKYYCIMEKSLQLRTYTVCFSLVMKHIKLLATHSQGWSQGVHYNVTLFKALIYTVRNIYMKYKDHIYLWWGQRILYLMSRRNSAWTGHTLFNQPDTQPQTPDSAPMTIYSNGLKQWCVVYIIDKVLLLESAQSVQSKRHNLPHTQLHQKRFKISPICLDVPCIHPCFR